MVMDRNNLIDLALSIAQDCAEEWHGKEYISSLKTERNEVNRKEMPALYDKLTSEIKTETADWLDGVHLRRLKMDILGAKSPAYDYHKRCILKHRATSFVTAVENYQSDPDTMNEKVMDWSEKRFWKALCQFMGVEEITDCGRCLSDQLNLSLGKEEATKNGNELVSIKIGDDEGSLIPEEVSFGDITIAPAPRPE